MAKFLSTFTSTAHTKIIRILISIMGSRKWRSYCGIILYNNLVLHSYFKLSLIRFHQEVK